MCERMCVMKFYSIYDEALEDSTFEGITFIVDYLSKYVCTYVLYMHA